MSHLPLAAYCTETRAVMNDPVLAMCGHLFERAELPTQCPVDKTQLVASSVITQVELTQRIKEWKSVPSLDDRV